jgi:hypothetical protein
MKNKKKIKKFKFTILGNFYVINSNSYIIMLCISLKEIFLTNSLQKKNQNQKKNKFSLYK